jgi:sugar diacid utilization regulator
MRIAENKVNYLDSLLEGADISEDIVSRYLDRIKWKLNGDFCFLTFVCAVDFSVPAAAVSYVKQLNALFPQALVSVYQNSIIMIVRCADYPVRRNKERQQLRNFLLKNDMRCGISMVFNNFMRLRYYYVQSGFAAAWCDKHPDSLLCYYEDCHRDHVLQSLGAATDIRSFCHPAILSLQESGDEKQQELVRCLHYYLINGGNLVTAAKTLFVHRSTLIYRLKKLSQVLQCDLKKLTPDQICFYLLSCVIARYGLA